MAVDVKVQRGTATIATNQTQATITAGVDYDAPASASAAFCRIVSSTDRSTITTDAATTPENFLASVGDATITTSVVFTRAAASASIAVRVDWEIVEYIGAAGGANEFIVRGRGELGSIGTAANTVTTGVVSGVVTDADVVPWITGGRSPALTSPGPTEYSFTSAWDAGADTATFTRVKSYGGVVVVSYAIVEFTGGNWAVQSVEHAIAAADTVETEAITSVGATTRAFLHTQSRGGSSTQAEDSTHQAWLSGVTAVSFYAPVGYVATLTAKTWVIANTQTGTGEMVVARYAGTITTAGTFSIPVTAAVMADTSVAESTASTPWASASQPKDTVSFVMSSTTAITGYRNSNTFIPTTSFRVATVTWPIAAGGGGTTTIAPHAAYYARLRNV